MVLEALKQRWPWVKRLFGDAAYDRRTLINKAAFLDLRWKWCVAYKGKKALPCRPGVGWWSVPLPGCCAGGAWYAIMNNASMSRKT